MLNQTIAPQPFIKWVGGKRQLLAELSSRLPPSFNGYFEPFVGGGALFWYLHARLKGLDYTPCIGDFNEELINTYQMVKKQPHQLIDCLKQFKNTEQFYYQVRSWDRCPSYEQRTDVERAARFIFLNKTGFNGLYRVNQNNQNNVPYGHYKNPTIFEVDNLLACSQLLQHTTIYQGEFDGILAKVQKGDLVYLDPPYVPINATSSFTGYTSTGFDLSMQYRLRDFCHQLNEMGVHFMLSNSAAALVYELYSAYHIDEVLAGRAINADGAGRGKITELIIRNY